eukprot:11403316-Alexandrium_andersonii.AAC.1
MSYVTRPRPGVARCRVACVGGEGSHTSTHNHAAHHHAPTPATNDAHPCTSMPTSAHHSGACRARARGTAIPQACSYHRQQGGPGSRPADPKEEATPGGTPRTHRPHSATRAMRRPGR